jgi:hypothetical protein
MLDKLKAAVGAETEEPTLRGPPEDLANLGDRGHITFEETAGSSFSVRIGPNYPKNGNKAPSIESMYDLASVDVFKTPHCVTHLGQRLRLPTPLSQDAAGTDAAAGGASSSTGLRLPPVLLISVALPQEAPGVLTGNQEAGSTLTTAFSFRLSKAAALAAASPSPPPAVQLLARYFAQACSDENVKKTFKMIGRARNYDDLGLPSWMKRFNGKPVIINHSGEVFTGNSNGTAYLEIDIIVARWSLWAKQGVHTLMPRYKEIDAEVGFVLQGTEDDELPEQMLGGARLPFVDVSSFPELNQ